MPIDVNTDFTPEQLVDEVVTQGVLLRIGQTAIAIMHRRTERGVFLDGPNTYSTKPAPMPLGGLIARLGKSTGGKVARSIQRGEIDGTVWRQSRTGKVWVTLMGGYKQLRELSGRESNRVSLNWSGSMLRAMRGVRTDTATKSVTLYFTDNRSAEIANWLQEEGAGRTKVKRRFFALNESELREVVKDTETALGVKL